MRVLLDANVLYPTVMREVLLTVARAELYVPLWSERILEEWARAAGKRGAGSEALARGDIALAKAGFPEALVGADAPLETRLWLPDANDVHVLVSAISGRADVILTMNAKDFPRRTLAEHGLTRLDPDGFLMSLWQAHSVPVERAVHGVQRAAERLSGEPQPLRKLLKKARLPRLGKAVASSCSEESAFRKA